MKRSLLVVTWVHLLAFSPLWAHPVTSPSPTLNGSGEWSYQFQPQLFFSDALESDQNPQWAWANLDQVQGEYRTPSWLVHGKAALAMKSDNLAPNQVKGPSSFWFDVKNLYLTWTPNFLQTSAWDSGLTVGRLRINDPLKSIVDHDADGFSWSWKGVGWTTRLEAGYTGFLEKKNTLLEDTTLDFQDRRPGLVLSPVDWNEYQDDAHFWDVPRGVFTSLTEVQVNPEIQFSLGLIYIMDFRSRFFPSSEATPGTTNTSQLGGDLSSFYAQTLLQVAGDFPATAQLILQKGQALMYRSDKSDFENVSIQAFSLGGAWGPAFFDRRLVIQGLVSYNSGDDYGALSPDAHQTSITPFYAQNSTNTYYLPTVSDNAVLGAPFYGGGLGMAGAQAFWDSLGTPAFPVRLEVRYKFLFRTNTGPLMAQGRTGTDRATYLGWAGESFLTVRILDQGEVNLGWSFLVPNTDPGSYWEGIPVHWLGRIATSVKWKF